MKQLMYYTAIIIALLVLNNISVSAQGEPVTAIPSNDFLNSIGVNSAISNRGESISQTEKCAAYLGFRFIRTEHTQLAQIAYRRLRVYYNVKIASLIRNVGSGQDGVNTLLEEARKLAEYDCLLAVEGPNEPNNWPVKFDGQEGGRTGDWIPVAKMQAAIYTGVKNDPVLKDYPVWHLSESGAEGNNVGLQFLTIPQESAVTLMPKGTEYSDFACCHNYFSHSTFEPVQDNQTWLSSDPAYGRGDGLWGNYGNTWGRGYAGYTREQIVDLQRVTTETGIKITIPSDPYYNTTRQITEEMQGLMYLSCYLAQFKRGWAHTAMYIMRDRQDEGEDQQYGFYDRDYNPRLSAHYLHNMTTILADNQSITNPGQLQYEVTGTRLETVHDLLLQEHNGTMVLVVWGERFKGGTDPVTVNFGETFEVVDIYNPVAGADPIETLNGVNSINLEVTNHPYIIKLNPVTTGIDKVQAAPIQVYPNPVYGDVYLNSLENISRLSISDLSGKVLLQRSNMKAGKTTVDIHSLPVGCYMIRLVRESGKAETHKIFKF
jgi:hypothetical protein